MKRTTTIAKQVVFEGYGFQYAGLEYVVIDGNWRAFTTISGSTETGLALTEKLILQALFEIQPLPEVKS